MRISLLRIKFYVAQFDAKQICFALAPCERKANLIRIKFRRMRNGKFELYSSYPWQAFHSNYHF